MKKLLLTLVAAGILASGASFSFAQADPKEKKSKKKESMAATDAAPKSVLHVVTVKFKEGTTEDQIKAVLDGVKAMPAKYKGMTRVWTKTIRVQNQREAPVQMTHLIAMEFADEAAFKGYTGSEAQLEWYKVYEPVRERSITHQVTN